MTADVEIVAACKRAKEVIRMKRHFGHMDHFLEGRPVLRVDEEFAIKLAQTAVSLADQQSIPDRAAESSRQFHLQTRDLLIFGKERWHLLEDLLAWPSIMIQS